jgi:hypothetical protein
MASSAAITLEELENADGLESFASLERLLNDFGPKKRRKSRGIRKLLRSGQLGICGEFRVGTTAPAVDERSMREEKAGDEGDVFGSKNGDLTSRLSYRLDRLRLGIRCQQFHRGEGKRHLGVGDGVLVNLEYQR